MSSPRVSPVDSPPFHPSLRRALALCFVFSLATLAHVESLSYWFVSTDVFGLIESSRVLSPADLVALFTEPLMDGTRFTEVGLFYRPIASLTYALDYAIWGLDPAGYHFTNLLLHGFAAVLVAIGITALLDRPLVGYSSAALFATHPLTAEVVPTAARRQDVLLTLFVLASLALFVRAYRGNSRPALVGALFAYALALGSKELAIFLPIVVAAWVLCRPDLAGVSRSGSDAAPRTRLDGALLSDGGHANSRVSGFDRRLPTDWFVRSRLGPASRATLPFLAVTACYLLVRVVALGGLGGYEGGSLAPGDLPLIPLDYLLSITYQSNVIWASVGPSGHWLAIVIPSIALLGLAIDRYGARPTRLRSPAMVARAGFAYGLGVLAYVLVFGPELVRSFPAQFRYPWVVSVLVGACFVLGTLSGICSLLLARDPPFGERASSLAFLGIWLAAPISLFYLGGEFTMRSGYPFVPPAMAVFSVLALDAVRAIRRSLDPSGDRRSDPSRFPLPDTDFDRASPNPDGPNRTAANPNGPNRVTVNPTGRRSRPSLGASVLVCCLVALLVVPQIAVSPLFHPYDGWETAGEINRETLSGLSAELVGVPDDTPVAVSGLSGAIGEQRRAFPRVESVGFLQENSIESWLRLQGSDRAQRVTIVDREPIAHAPQDISFETVETAEGPIEIRVRYDPE